ncbi:MAG: hypothetical protein DRN83_03725 [Hadesarchaea archaeon]|nr:MAG: hypothetical protein DRN83_03725 [Hadesarchaea archaeon]
MEKIKAILFDLDETIINAPVSLAAAQRVVASEVSNFVRGRINKKEIYLKIRALDDRMNMSGRYNRHEWWPMLLAELGIKKRLPPQDTEKLTKLYWDTFTETTKPYPDAESTLLYLKKKGYKLGLVTDTDGVDGAKRERMKRLELVKLFDVIVVGGEDTPRPKPSPEPFLLAASRLGLNPNECAVVGDKPFTDIKGGKSAGMLTIWLKRRDWGIEEIPNMMIRSLKDLTNIF